MNRGFRKYFKTGVHSAAGAILKGGKIFKYYAYYLVSLLCCVVPFINVLFRVAYVRHAKIVKEDGQMPFARAFGGIDTGNAYGAALLAFIIKYLIILGGILIIGIIGAALYFIGGFVASLTGMANPEFLPFIFAAPAALELLIYVVVMLLLYAPVAYIVDSHTNVRASEVLTASSETMRSVGKGTYILNILVPLLIKAVYLLFVSAGYYLLMKAGAGNMNVWVYVIYAVVALIPYIIFAPVFTLATAIANNCLFEDIALDPASMSCSTKGVMIKRSKVTNSLAFKGRDSNLEALFNSAPKASAAPPDTKYVPPTDRVEKMRVYEEETATPVPENDLRINPVKEEKPEPVQEIKTEIKEVPAQAAEPEPAPVQEVKPATEQAEKAEPVKKEPDIDEDGFDDEDWAE